MSFHLRLEVTGDLSTLTRNSERVVQPAGPLGPEDELVHALTAQCRALAETGRIQFHVGGFGDPRWRVDVRTDLAVALEQLPAVVAGLRQEGRSFQLNFFEQGIECYLKGTRRDGVVTFECTTTRMNWTPDPSIESMPLAEAQRIFRELADSFCKAVDVVCPWLSNANAFHQWKDRIVSSPS